MQPQTHWGQPPEQTPPQPSVSHQHDAMRSHMQITEQHRSSLAQQIGAFRAQSDTCKAQAAAYPDRAEQLNAESARQADCARMLERRLGQLLGEIHVAQSQQAPAAEPKAERMPWQKEAWWDALDQMHAGLEQLASDVGNNAALVGPMADVRIGLARSFARMLERPDDISQATVGPAMLDLRSIPDALAPLPWHLLDWDAKRGADLVSLSRWLVGSLPPRIVVSEELRSAEIKREFMTILASMDGHRDVGRMRGAMLAYEDGQTSRASAILSGITPPDPLRYAVSRLALLIVGP